MVELTAGLAELPAGKRGRLELPVKRMAAKVRLSGFAGSTESCV